MLREIGIDYVLNPNDKEVLELGLRKFNYSAMSFNGKEVIQHDKDVWIQGNREDALILINNWNRRAFIQASEKSLYSYHLNP